MTPVGPWSRDPDHYARERERRAEQAHRIGYALGLLVVCFLVVLGLLVLTVRVVRYLGA